MYRGVASLSDIRLTYTHGRDQYCQTTPGGCFLGFLQAELPAAESQSQPERFKGVGLADFCGFISSIDHHQYRAFSTVFRLPSTRWRRGGIYLSSPGRACTVLLVCIYSMPTQIAYVTMNASAPTRLVSPDSLRTVFS